MPEAGLRPAIAPAAFFGVALLAVLWGWWAWQEGAYFEDVMLPGAILLCAGAALFALKAPIRIDLRLSKAAAVAIVALFALAAWSAASGLWSPVPDVAIVDGIRTAVYATSFTAGLWVSNLLATRMELAIVPLAAAGAFAGVAALIALATGDVPLDLLEEDGTLDYPLNYRNATAAFFAIALFPALGVASSRAFHWIARGAALATATLCLALFLLCQSRASLPALALAVLAYLLLSPLRVRALAWLALAAAPALLGLPALSELYQAASDAPVRSIAGPMHEAAATAAGLTLASMIVGLGVARFEARVPGLGATSPRGNRAVAGLLAGTVLAGAIAFTVAVGDPVDWLNQRVDEFERAGSPDLSQESSRFGLNASSDRYDLWRVALEDAREDPLLGTGAGGFRVSYTAEREVAYQNVLDAHSVELELLAELGVPGLALLLAALAAITVGVLRARRLGPSAAALGAVALASGTYWLVHSSVDWFWAYPAVTAPTFALLGAACAPPLRTIGERAPRGARYAVLAVAAVIALASLPLLLADRYLDGAYAGWRDDLDGAYADLDRAAALNPLSDASLLAEGAIAREAGDSERAIAAFREATEKRPEGWAAHHLLAALLAEADPEEAREHAQAALELNPLSERVRSLARRLGLEPPPAPDDG